MAIWIALGSVFVSLGVVFLALKVASKNKNQDGKGDEK